ncbi:MAG: hypothetical protein ACE5G0_22665, partial [Rhodothermales bacterium]
GISQIAQSSDGLNRLTEELRQLVGRFMFFKSDNVGRSLITERRDVGSPEDRPAQRLDGSPIIAEVRRTSR